MKPFLNQKRSQIEAYLLESKAGYDVLDAMVQANIDLSSLTLEDLQGIVDRETRTTSAPRCR